MISLMDTEHQLLVLFLHDVVGIDIVVNWNDVIRQTSLQRFRAHKGLSSDRHRVNTFR